MRKKLTIVIIDSGVWSQHPHFKGKCIEQYVVSTNENTLIIEDNDADSFGHGTAIYNIISKCDEFARIINIKIKGIENDIDEEVLIGTLNLVSTEFNPDLINLSLGINTCDNYQALFESCKNLTDKGSIIVSAFDNTGSISYPAAFENVIGVISGQYCNKTNEFGYIFDEIVNVSAKGSIQRVAWTKPEYLMISGNSYACAHVTVQAANFINDGYATTPEILEQFLKISISQHHLNHTPQKDRTIPFKIHKAAIFPFNKEMHSLLRYNDLLPFEITDVLDTKYSSNVGATTTHLMKNHNIKEYVITNVNNVNWTSFDTLILGHLDELSNLLNKQSLKNELVTQAINYGKNVVSFDDLSPHFSEYKNIYYPIIDESDLPPDRFGMLFRISKPVLGVVGTSSRQGKFTLQLKIREFFLKHGYNVGQIGSEPSSLLYGMDYVFPMGYNSSVYIRSFDIIRYLNWIINNLCLQNKDIILVGSQSGTITYDMGHLSQYAVPQYHFLLGTQPDAVILCINPYDGIDYILRTIKFIESSIECRVIALVIFPMQLKNDWSSIYNSKEPLTDEEYLEIHHRLVDTFSLPVYLLGNDQDMTTLMEHIISFFT